MEVWKLPCQSAGRLEAVFDVFPCQDHSFGPLFFLEKGLRFWLFSWRIAGRYRAAIRLAFGLQREQNPTADGRSSGIGLAMPCSNVPKALSGVAESQVRRELRHLEDHVDCQGHGS